MTPQQISCKLFYVGSRVGRLLATLALLAACFAMAGCGKKTKVAKPPRIGDTEEGIASWYGHPYHGRRAANGEISDMEKLTAAHRTLPFETWVRVENLTNRKTVDLRIQDRGPFIDGRIIDLSRAGAREIDLIGPGITRVRLTVISPPRSQPALKEDAPATSGAFAVQVGAFQEMKRAEGLRRSMEESYGVARLVRREARPAVWRVIVGDEPSLEAAEALAARIRAAGGDALAVRVDPAADQQD